MRSVDQKTLFTALGFLAVVLQDETLDKRAIRAKAIAELMDQFCAEATSERYVDLRAENPHPAQSRELLEDYIAELRDAGSASLNYDRHTLLDMYEILLVQKMWHEQREFFATGHEDLIAGRILKLAEERIQWESAI